MRDDERRSLSLGYDVDRYKLAAIAVAAACAGLAGSLNTVVFQLATLSGVHWQFSGEAVLMALIGGIGTSAGPLVGAAILVTMQQFLAPLGAWVLVIQGALFAACVLVFREGVMVKAMQLRRRVMAVCRRELFFGKQIISDRV